MFSFSIGQDVNIHFDPFRDDKGNVVLTFIRKEFIYH